MAIQRRELIRGLLAAALLRALVRGEALAAPARIEAKRLLDRLDAASRALGAGELREAAWQDEVEMLARSADLDSLRRAIDFDRLSASLAAEHDTQGGRSLPARAGAVYSATRLFCLRKGDAITPHGHRNMASMHLVLGGELRVRHFDRVRDERDPPPARDGLSPAGGFLVLRPSIDRVIRAGDATSISGERDNVHWFVARSERAYTFDCIVSGLRPLGFSYGIDLVDPAHADRTADGTLRAPVIGWDDSIRLYGHG